MLALGLGNGADVNSEDAINAYEAVGEGVGVVVGIGVKIGVGVTVGVALGADYFKSLSHITTNVVVSDDFLLVGSSQISPVMMNSSPSTAFEGTSAW